ncbi:MAG: alkaline phosphatase family protein [Peptococcaceae bacterium]|nr:alkaline phosphatase family protein [Peptococcaceae bacterium]MBP3625734.1 alkaline phosphatase family protein [Peptococcaceae bacterium]
MDRKASADKILILGIDGMDPRLTRKYVDEGKMPNVKKYIEAGAQRHDLVMLGGHPTVTPPMWTTMATGCYSNVHGITGFFRNGPEIGSCAYNIDSRLCKAEPLWNCFAEAGKKTLVWHWPGSSWPPTSDSENLYVVDGTSPGCVGMAVAQVDAEFIVEASTEIQNITFGIDTSMEAQKVCIVEDLDAASAESGGGGTRGEDDEKLFDRNKLDFTVIWKEEQFCANSTELPLGTSWSSIKPAAGWAAAPADAKEFVLLLSSGLIRRPALILKNEEGKYDRVAIYKSKKEVEPIVVCPLGEMVPEVVDEAIKGDKKFEKVNRNYKLLRLSEDGNYLKMYISAGMDMTNDSVWHPKRIFKEVTENVGYPPSSSLAGCQDPVLISECMLANWYVAADWQSASILHLMESEKLDVVFSHFHSIDIEAHQFIKHTADRPFNRNPVSVAQKWLEDLYIQVDYYLGKFIHKLDEGWTILIMSDHAQVAAKHDIPMLVDMTGVSTLIMEELGYTVLKRDANGERIGEIDWTKTRAISQRDGFIYLNVKGRDTHKLADGTVVEGIVDPADKYDLEEQIITDLYGYKHPVTGHRIVAVALRNKDAVLLGQGGPEAGDICIWMAEGYNYDHGDSLSTTYGESETSVSPIFIAAGKGVKKGFETDRIIRQIDFAPTVAVLGGVRMPAQCEGAPVYQILADEY